MLGAFIGISFAIEGALRGAEEARRAVEAAKAAAAPQTDVIDISPEDVRVIEDVKLIEGPEVERDWQIGLPPFGLQVEATVRGHVRSGHSDGVRFRFSDCTHPMQNSVVDVHEVEAWRLKGEVRCA